MALTTSEVEQMGGFWAWLFGRKAKVHPTVEQERPGALYPTSFETFVGQREVVMLLKVEAAAAKRMKRPLTHLLFTGPPGLGKTAAAHVLASEVGAVLYESSGPEYPDQSAALLTLDDLVILHEKTGLPVVWLIDEIDGMARSATYSTHGVMTHGFATWRGHRLYEGLPLTIIGTSNFLASVPGALKSRFGDVLTLEYYPPEDLTAIAVLSARRLGLELTQEAADFIGANAAGEPRKINNRLLRTAQNVAANLGVRVLDEVVVKTALKMSGLKPLGLTAGQFRCLEFLEKMPKRTAGLSTIAARLQMGVKDVMSEVEGWLIYKGFMLITPRGRQLSDDGAAYLELARKEMTTW